MQYIDRNCVDPTSGQFGITVFATLPAVSGNGLSAEWFEL